jgi:hypothetical protein
MRMEILLLLILLAQVAHTILAIYWRFDTARKQRAAARQAYERALERYQKQFRKKKPSESSESHAPAAPHSVPDQSPS